MDTGFDAALYANIDLLEFLVGATPVATTSLQVAGHRVTCELFDVECHITDQYSTPILKLGTVEAYCPTDPINLAEDVIVGRTILNRLKLELDGKLTKLSASEKIRRRS